MRYLTRPRCTAAAGDRPLSISFPFNSNGNKGIAVGLNALKKKRDDEPLGGTITVDSAISDFEDSDDGFDDDLLG